MAFLSGIQMAAILDPHLQGFLSNKIVRLLRGLREG